MFKTIGFLSREVGFLAKKWVLLMKKTNPYGKSIGKSPKTAKIGRKIAKSGWISTIFVENLTEHQARAYSGREALNRAHRGAFRGKSQVGGNPENPGFYPALHRAHTDIISADFATSESYRWGVALKAKATTPPPCWSLLGSR
jgi:hypothetical protein